MRFPIAIKAFSFILVLHEMLLVITFQASINSIKPQAEADQSNNSGISKAIVTRLGILQCRAKHQRAPARKESATSKFNSNAKSDSKKAQDASSNEKAQSAQVIMLPPIESDDQDNNVESKSESFNDNRSNSNDSADDEESSQAETLAPEEQDYSAEMESEDDGASSGNGIEPQQQGQKRLSSIWDQIKRPLKTSLKRYKRQLTSLNNGGLGGGGGGSGDPLEDAAREVLGLRPRRPSLITPELMQQVVSSMFLMIQQILALIVGRTASDLPVRMANYGQLIANIITALTVNNPVIANSPLLVRTQQPALAASGSSPFNALTPDAAANRSSILDAATRLLRALSAPQDQIQASQTQLLGTVDGQLQMQLQSPKNDSLTRNAITTTTTTTTTTTATPIASTRPSVESNQVSSSVSTLAGRETTTFREVDFVDRLNGLTSSSLVAANDDNSGSSMQTREATPSGNSSSRQQAKVSQQHSRTKRSVGSLLLFGPFSKFYIAMMLTKALKYQSNVVTQAVVGELVRRFILPSVTSTLMPGISPLIGGQLAGAAAGLGGVSNAFNQMRQTALSAVAGGQLLQQQQQQQQLLMQPQPSNIVPSRVRNRNVQRDNSDRRPEETRQQQSAAASAESDLLFDADCQLVSNGEQSLQGSENATSQLTTTTTPIDKSPLGLPMSLFASALNNPAMTLDQNGLHFNPPNSALKYTIPNLLTGQQNSLQAMLKQLNELQSNISSSLMGQHFPDLMTIGGDRPGRSRNRQHQNPSATRYLYRDSSSQNHYPGPFASWPLPPPHLPKVKMIGSPYDWPDQAAAAQIKPDSFETSLAEALQQNVTSPLGAIDNNNTLLSDFVTKASPGQLLGLLNQVGQSASSKLHNPAQNLNTFEEQHQQLIQSIPAQFDQSPPQGTIDNEDELVQSITKARSAGAGAAAQRFSQLGPAQRIVANSNRTTATNPFQVDELAETILDKTLELQAARNLGSSQRDVGGSPDNISQEKLIRETSKLLASSFAQLIKGLDFGPTAETTSSSMRSNKSVEHHQQLARNESQMNGIDSTKLPNAADKQSAIQITMSADNAAKLMDKMLTNRQQQNNNSSQVMEFSALPSTTKPELGHGSIDATSRVSSPILGNEQAVSSSSNQVSKLQAGTAWKAMNSSDTNEMGKNYNSDQGRSIERPAAAAAVDETQFDKLQPLKNNQRPRVPNHPAKAASVGLRPQNQPALKLSRGVAVASPQSQPRNVTNSKSGGDSLASLKLSIGSHSNTITAPAIRQAEGALKAQLPESDSMTVGTNSSKVTSKSDEDNNQSQPLNNLAMALNVMNMVLLNQRLAAKGSNSSETADRLGTNGSRLPVRLKLNSTAADLQIVRPSTKQKRKQQLKKVHRHRHKQAGNQRHPAPSSSSNVNGDADRSTSSTSPTKAAAAAATSSPAPLPKADLERETTNSNHRTSSSRLVSNATLLVVDKQQRQERLIKQQPPSNYHYQPLPVGQQPTIAATSLQQSNQTTSKQSSSDTNNSSFSEQEEHASRWNDVLQHINLATP